MKKPEININITAKNITQFQKIENCLNAIGDIELVNKFDRVEEFFDIVKFHTSIYATMNEIQLPPTCRVSSVEYGKETVDQKEYYTINLTVRVTPREKSVSPFAAIFYFRNHSPQIKIMNNVRDF